MHLQGCFKENINHMKARWLFLECYVQVKFIFQYKRRHQLNIYFLHAFKVYLCYQKFQNYFTF